MMQLFRTKTPVYTNNAHFARSDSRGGEAGEAGEAGVRVDTSH